MKKKVKWIVMSAAAIALITVIVFMNTRPVQVDVVEAVYIEFAASITEDGTVSMADDYHVYSNVSGKVLEVYVNKEDYVEAGAIIAKIDTSDYESQILSLQHNIKGYEAKIAEVATSDRNMKDDYQASIDRLKAQLTQTESKIKLESVNGITNILPSEQINILDLSIEQYSRELDAAKDYYDKCNMLFQSGGISRNELEQAERAYQTAQNQLEQSVQKKQSLEQELNRIEKEYAVAGSVNELSNLAREESNQATIAEIQAQITALENNLTKDYVSNTAQYYNSLIGIEQNQIQDINRTISDCTITAGRSGYITSLPVMDVSNVVPQTVICTIREKAELKVESYVATEDVVDINMGDKVDLVQKTRDRDIIYPGTVTGFSEWAEEQVSALGIIDHKVKVTITPNVSMDTLKSGYNLDVRYYTYKNDECIVLPNSAFFTADGKDFVFVVSKDGNQNTGVISAVQVVKGASTNTETVVESGLKIGDIVVRNATGEGVSAGSKVTWK